MIHLLVTIAASAADPTIEQLLDRTDDVARGASSMAVVEMHVKTANYERTMKMQAWSEGTDKTLIRILEPAKDAGIATLKVGDNIWNYLPKVDRTMKVPAGMMSGSWMGSHFTNDDLVKDSRLSDDFTYTMTGKPASGGFWVIELVPKPDAAIVWGKIVVKITPDELPAEMAFYDEKGTLARTMTYTDVREFDGRKVPSTMRLSPADKPGEFTELKYAELDFDPTIAASTFTLQGLK
ncbi:MAG: outer membrane lipoprotein-sorting protein [Myxococcota bacterium]